MLAGEVKSPGNYSIRTLEFLRGLSKEEAEIISKMAGYVIQDRIIIFGILNGLEKFINITNLDEYLDKQGITTRLLRQIE
ncbi:MAG: DUF2806 domain-containing protein [Candidatus Methylumidiphilus sp.]